MQPKDINMPPGRIFQHKKNTASKDISVQKEISQ
jgi:hypothetical protein